MRSTKLITARVPPDTKAKFQALAATYGLNESRFLRSLIDRAVEVVGGAVNADREVTHLRDRLLI
jgi:antitoxin component of RelBE/YafQ-DinJ toxin-antitoxin module